MAYYKHKRTGKIIEVAEGVKMISLWEPLVMPEKHIPDERSTIADASEIQTFETVVDLKKNADKSLPAKTVRGSIYDYVSGEWVKRSGE